MRHALIAVLLTLPAAAHASVSYNNAQVLNVTVATGTATAPVVASPYSLVIDLAAADSASWQMTATCAKGQVKLQASNDGTNWVDFNLAGSSITWPQTAGTTGSTTVSSQLFAVAAPAYRYAQFVVSNTSAPAAGVAANCTATATQLLRSLTIKSN